MIFMRSAADFVSRVQKRISSDPALTEYRVMGVWTSAGRTTDFQKISSRKADSSLRTSGSPGIVLCQTLL